MKSVVSKVVKTVRKTTAGNTSSEELNNVPIRGSSDELSQLAYDYYHHYPSEQSDSDCSYMTYRDRYNQKKYSFYTEWDKKSLFDKTTNYHSLGPQEGYYGGIADIVDIYDKGDKNKFCKKNLLPDYNENHWFYGDNEIIEKDRTLNSYNNIKQKPIFFNDLKKDSSNKSNSKRKRSVSPPVRLQKVKKRKTSHHDKKNLKKCSESPDVKTLSLSLSRDKRKKKKSSKNKKDHKKSSKKIKKHSRSIKQYSENDEFFETSFKPMKINNEEEPDLITTILQKNSILEDSNQSLEDQKSLAMSRLMKHYNKNMAVSEILGRVRKKMKEQKLSGNVTIKNANNEDSSKLSSNVSGETMVSTVCLCPSDEFVLPSVQSGPEVSDETSDEICTKITNKDCSDSKSVEQSNNFIENSNSFNDELRESVLPSSAGETEAVSEDFESENTINSKSFSTPGNITLSVYEKLELLNDSSDRSKAPDDGLDIVEDTSKEANSRNVEESFDAFLTELSPQLTNLHDIHRNEENSNVEESGKVDEECVSCDQSNETDFFSDVKLNEVEGHDSAIFELPKSVSSQSEDLISTVVISKSSDDHLKQNNDLKSTSDLREIVDNLEQMDVDLKSTDDCMKSTDDCTKSKDDCTKSKDDCTKSKDDCTKSKDDCTKSMDDCTKSKDDCTKSMDDCTKSKDDCTKSKDDCTKSEEDCTKLKDDCTKSKDDCTKSEEDCTKLKDDCTKSKDNCTKSMHDQNENGKNDVWPIVNMSIVKPVGSSKGMAMNLKISEKSASFIASGEVVFHRKIKNLEDGELSDDNGGSSSSSSDGDESEDKSTAGTSSYLTSSSCVDVDSTGSLSESDEEKVKNKNHKKKKKKKETKIRKLKHRGRSRSFSVTRTFDAEFGVWREKKIRKKIREPILTVLEKDKLRRIAMTAAMSSKDTDRYIKSFRISRETHDKQKKIAQLTNFCKSLARRNGSVSGKSSDEDDCEKLMMMSDNEDMVGCLDLIEKPRIVMNIRDARVVNAQDKQLKAEVLREVYPISSGVMHHARNKGWVPVEKDVEATQKNLQSPPKRGNQYVTVPPESLTNAAGAAIQLANAQNDFKVPTTFPYDQTFLHNHHQVSSYKTSRRFQPKSVLLKRKSVFSKLQESFIPSTQPLLEVFESQNEVQSNELSNILQPEIPAATEPCSSELQEISIPLVPTASLKASLNCLQNYNADTKKSIEGNSEGSAESSSTPAPIMDPNLLLAFDNRLKAPKVHQRKASQLQPAITRISASYLSAFQSALQPIKRIRNSHKNNQIPRCGARSEIGKILLMKMGWKEGELLGSTSSNANPGLPAPIDVAFKNDKKGLQSEEERIISTSLAYKAVVHDKHPVSKLGEICTKSRLGLPSYDLVEETGPSHRKYFRYKVVVNGKEYIPVTASCSKKAAKCDAAICCLMALNIL